MLPQIQTQLSALLERLAAVSWKERESVKTELQTAAEQSGDRTGVIRLLEEAKRGMGLELRWEVEEIIEALTPHPVVEEVPPAPPEEVVEEDALDRPLSYADLVAVYEDPRGFALHRTKNSKRWFATQLDPATRQPQTFEITTEEADQLKARLGNSPYWVVGG